MYFLQIRGVISAKNEQKWRKRLEMTNLLFVYGTLRKDMPTPAHRFLSAHSDFVAERRIGGILYDTGYYPAAIVDGDARRSIVGDVFCLRAPAAGLPVLDEYEGCTAASTSAALFRRESVPVRLANGASVAAWIYIYDRSVAGLVEIPSGDYRQHYSSSENV